jgi:hypothetical protein
LPEKYKFLLKPKLGQFLSNPSGIPLPEEIHSARISWGVGGVCGTSNLDEISIGPALHGQVCILVTINSHCRRTGVGRPQGVEWVGLRSVIQAVKSCLKTVVYFQNFVLVGQLPKHQI